MNEPHDPLDAALRAPEPTLSDDEFSANVLARLPPQRRRTNARRWTVAGSAALGSALTLAFAAPLETVLASISPWSIPPLALSAVAVIAIVALPTLLVFFTERADR
jgi:predicted MFS family arabinose efflux permease